MKKWAIFYTISVIFYSFQMANAKEMESIEIKQYAGFVPIGNSINVKFDDGSYLILNEDNKEIARFEIEGEREKCVIIDKNNKIAEAGMPAKVNLIIVARRSGFFVFKGGEVLVFNPPKK
jgi:hypothetical protein